MLRETVASNKPNNMTLNTWPRRTAQKPNTGPPMAKPRKQNELTEALAALLKLNILSRKGFPHKPPNTAKGANAKPL